MVLELTGSRLMAPYLGTSIYVWTSLIGVILGCLSLGYWLGGQLADRRPDPKRLTVILLSSGILVALIALTGDVVLVWLQRVIVDVRTGSVVATILLFGLPSVLLGMIAPYAVRLKLTHIEKTGTTAGGLYALSTLGSIAGTFLAGFFLLSYFSHRSVLFIISLTLILLAPLAWNRTMKLPATVLFAAIFSLSFTRPWLEIAVGDGFIEEHTTYNRVWIFDGFVNERPVRFLQLNDTYDSAIYTDTDELVLEYGKYFRIAEHFNANMRNALMIGGGVYSIPMAILKEIPHLTMDVVEIDPGLQRIAATYFNVNIDAHPRLNLFQEDGRTFLNRTTNSYDVVYCDAIKSFTVPFQLATQEAMNHIHRILDDDGLLMMNIITVVEGERGMFLRALLATVESVFPHVLLFAVRDNEDAARMQNIIVVALKSMDPPVLTNDHPEIDTLLSKQWLKPIPRDVPVMTDRFAPVDRYTKALITRQPELRYGYVQQSVQAYFQP